MSTFENTKSAKEVATEFEAELKALLKKYNAFIEMNDDWNHEKICVYIREKWQDGKLLSEYAELNLGTSYDGH